MEDRDAHSEMSEGSSTWSNYFCDSFKPACYEKTWELELDVLPLHAAVLKGNAAAAQKLLDSRAFPSGEHIDMINKNTNGAPIHAAIRNGDLDMIELLLDYGAFVHSRAPDKYGELSIPALTVAVNLGRADIVQVLLDADADPAVTDRRTIEIAAELGNVAIIELLLKWSKSRESPLDKDFALINAAREWRVEATWALLKDGIEDTNVLSNALLSTVDSRHWAESNVIPFILRFDETYRAYQSTIMSMLLDAGADPNHQRRSPDARTQIQNWSFGGADAYGQRSHPSTTPLQVAASATGSAGAVRLLLERRAYVNMADDFGQTALFYATISNDMDVIKTLLEWGADVRATDLKLSTPLHMAARYSSPPITELLLNWGADPFAKDLDDETALHAAANNTFEINLEIIDKLVQLGVDINARRTDGWTPLINAIASKDEIKCRYLLANGADVNVITTDNQTALQRAISWAVGVPVVNTLLDYGAHIVGPDQSTALHWAVGSRKPYTMMWCLLARGLNPNIKDSFGATALTNVVTTPAFQEDWSLRKSLITLLLSRGADAGVVDCLGRTVKDWAQGIEYMDINWDQYKLHWLEPESNVF
ncbi:hypothetical protein D8B26_002726 [Coccidioides posadasii str. Silveira]|uniref:Uncharacterized protein n=3 Tax=Coccidioides posadasii TaxID=199306 RepID=E9CYH3_COCPS|nr:ankyrin repeat containing protein [Coccidioides posadasii C735 delta SOWgp]EER27087.1 ankyrin repeat containing protein [Coccidioides posadasii C735 delta SOWgp]EFW21000.1 conserved hypothetical protein [Coccidioides posadasii str. Silveira]QVM08030.1 hypothetical protein D8B26_002726 [Coccidioides posadasii str. Silveira]|eukprot:XP_003069232.1 ankyrin repeat containing protein [Coccidioides posadasii C735 delta SOWgp]